MTDRKTAEAARRRALEIERIVNSWNGLSPDQADARADLTGELPPEARPELEDERAECVKVWNEFCAQESRRLAARRRNGESVAVYETYRKLGWS